MMVADMARRTFTDAEKAEALELYREHGASEAGRRLGIPEGTIASWASREIDPATGERLARVRAEELLDGIEQHVVSMEARKAKLAVDLMGDIERLRAQLFAPCTEPKVVTLSGGKDAGATWEIVDIEREQPSFTDQRAVMTSIAIAVDKVQILTGAATERIDHRHTTPIDDELERLAATLEPGDRQLVDAE